VNTGPPAKVSKAGKEHGDTIKFEEKEEAETRIKTIRFWGDDWVRGMRIGYVPKTGSGDLKWGKMRLRGGLNMAQVKKVREWKFR
jgi:hypothetical protein